jgi:hypothetical protein
MSIPMEKSAIGKNGSFSIAAFVKHYFLPHSVLSGGFVRRYRFRPTELVLLFEVGTGSGRLMMGLEEWGGPI